MRFALSLLGAFMVAAAAPAAAVAPASRAADTAAVKAVLADYVRTLESLDLKGSERLFTDDSTIFESGGSEGSYAHYLAHHMIPELGEFKSFRYRDHAVSVRFEGPLALASETYKYRIETKAGVIAERLGVATSVLRREHGRWRIVTMHNSSRHPPE